MTVIETALQYVQAGISVIPIKSDGSKAPACDSWKGFQERIATHDEIQHLFSNACGIGAITGQVSGFLEAIDCEADAPFHKWLCLVESQDAALATSLVLISTPSGGHHAVYRCPEGIQGNQKLAMRLEGTVPKVLIETRGEGGYVLTVGSPTACHPMGKPYTLLQGDLIAGTGEPTIPTITAVQRSLLLDAARAFNQAGKQKSTTARVPPSEASGDRPGDVFNQRSTWQEILIPHDWKLAGRHGDETFWRRPGKEVGLSATSNYQGSDLLYVFSTNAHPFEHETSYSKFAAFTVLEHGGDYKAAARAIAERFGLSQATRAGKNDKNAEDSAFVAPAHWKWLDVANLADWNCLPLRWTVQDLIAQGNFVIIAAETQTGKTLFGLFLSHHMLHEGKLFERLPITPVDKILYMGLEDPDRRFKERLLDVQHSFPKVEPGRFIVHTAPDFTLMDERMILYLEQLIVRDGFKVVFLDTYQKATPGLTSFDDEKQAVILHRLSNLTRKHDLTIIVLDHVRKRDGKQKRNILSVDDIKGTGSKPQNADCIILAERTPDRKQIKMQSFSKDSDKNIRILLDISPKGSQEGKFKYAGDLEQLGADSKAKGAANRAKVQSVFGADDRLSTSEVAEKTGLSEPTSRSHLGFLVESGQLSAAGKGKARRYWLQSAEGAKQ